MTYDLALGDRSYSSWSLRAWLLFERFGLPVRIHWVDFLAASVAEQLKEFAPARTVPALRLPEGVAIAESLAIAEELATRHPDAGLWPADPAARAVARALTCEMHAGFGPLRGDCPMNLRAAYEGFQPSQEVLDDIARIELIWGAALDRFGGPWLCGEYSVADAFFAPVAARIAGYGLAVAAQAERYVAAHLADPSFRRWRAMGTVSGARLPWYHSDLPERPWPGPEPLAAAVVADGRPENAACPYSGRPSTHFMEVGRRTFGFCNAFCRDKTLADPEAWPAFMAIYRS